MKVLIVYAHPEPRSFSRALLDAGVEAMSAMGWDVRVSDLYAKRFDPVASGSDFLERRFDDRLQYDREQKHAAGSTGFSPDIAAELADLLWCDQLILHFPLWWWSVPAIMKGWIDRVFVNGMIYGAGMRLENGGLKGRRAMLAFTTGCYPEMAGPRGMLGNIEASLWHLHSGTFHYAGLEVIPPFIGWKVRYADADAWETTLRDYQAHLRAMQVAKPLRFHVTPDVGDDWRLRDGVSPLCAAYARDGWRLPIALDEEASPHRPA